MVPQMRYIVLSSCSVQLQEPLVGRACALECGPDKSCYWDTCCARAVDQADPGSRFSSSQHVDSFDRRRYRRHFTNKLISSFNPYITENRQKEDGEICANGVVASAVSMA